MYEEERIETGRCLIMMFSDEIHGSHLKQLNQLRLYIDALDFESRMIEHSEFVPINVLLVAITVDYMERDRFINFSFVPISDEELDHTNLLQFYTTMPIELKLNNRIDVEKLLLAINTRMAVGHFGIQDNGEIYIRHIYSAHRLYGMNEQLIVETILLFIAMIDMHEELIDGVAKGKIELEEALRILEE